MDALLRPTAAGAQAPGLRERLGQESDGPPRRPLGTGGREARSDLARLFARSNDDVGIRLDEFPKYVRRQRIARLLALYEVFRLTVGIKGSVVNCGVFRGFSLMAFAHFSAILEPLNMRRRVYGFDTFAGFPTVTARDEGRTGAPATGDLAAGSSAELDALARVHDANRYLGNREKISLIVGDANETIPAFVRSNPHLIVSLLFLDFDLYEPTRVALEQFLSRMPRGAVVAFDELDHPRWPGETLALLETVGIRRLALERLPFDTHIAYAKLD